MIVFSELHFNECVVLAFQVCFIYVHGHTKEVVDIFVIRCAKTTQLNRRRASPALQISQIGSFCSLQKQLHVYITRNSAHREKRK